MCLLSLESKADSITFGLDGHMTGEVLSADENFIKFKSPASSHTLSFKQDKLNTVTFRNQDTSPSSRDNIILINGDLLPCHITNIKEGQVFLSLWGQDTSIPLDKVSAVFLASTRDIPLITGAQNLSRKILSNPPVVPTPFTQVKESEQTNEKSNNKPASPLLQDYEEGTISRDNWESSGTTGWKWIGNEEKNSLEISATRGIMTKVFPMLTERFTLSASYLGTPTNSMRNDAIFSTDPTQSPKGINFLFGGRPKNHRDYFTPTSHRDSSQSDTPPFYALALFPTEIVLSKLNSNALNTNYPNKKTHILFHYKFNNKNAKNKGYDFKLVSRGKEFRLFLEGKQVASAYDDTPTEVTPGTFSLFNGSFMPVILKNLQLVTHAKTNTNFLPSNNMESSGDSVTTPLLVTNDGDYVPGELISYDEENNLLRWKVKDSSTPPLSLSTNALRALYFHKANPTRNRLRMKFDDSEFIKGTIKSLNDQEFFFLHPLLDEIRIPRPYINRIEYSNIPSF